jgi:hypothetical protein
MDTGGGNTSIIPMTHTTTTDANAITRGEIERIAARTTDAGKLAELRDAWRKAPTHHVCAGCRRRGRAGNPLVHGRLGFMHAPCDRVS